MAEQSTLGQFVLKNTLDVPDDTVLFDPINDNPISFFKNVLAARATPNTFRTRKRFYGRFITQLYADGSAGKTGNGMWDDVIAALKRAGGESTQEMKLFVAIVHVPELQSYKFPAKEDWDTIHKVASNGGVFKSYVYSGEVPKYGDNVLVSFNDPATRSEGIFLHPLVGGAAGGWDDSEDDQNSLQQRYQNCSNSPPTNTNPPSRIRSENEQNLTEEQKAEQADQAKAEAEEELKQIEEQIKLLRAELNTLVSNIVDMQAITPGNPTYTPMQEAIRVSQIRQSRLQTQITELLQQAETLKAAARGDTPNVNQQRPAQPCVSFDGPPSQPFTGPGSLEWVKIEGNDRVHLKSFSTRRKQHGTAKMQHYLSGLKTVPAGNNVPSQPRMQNFKPGWYIEDVSWAVPQSPTGVHKSHQTGIDVDLSIPIKDGKMNLFRWGSGTQWGFKKITPDQIDIEMNLLFLKYTAPHASAAFLDRSLINALKNAAKTKSDAGTDGWNEDLFKVIFGPSRYGGFYIGHVSGHRNHYHIRLKPPGLYDERTPIGQLDGVSGGSKSAAIKIDPKTGQRV